MSSAQSAPKEGSVKAEAGHVVLPPSHNQRTQQRNPPQLQTPQQAPHAESTEAKPMNLTQAVYNTGSVNAEAGPVFIGNANVANLCKYTHHTSSLTHCKTLLTIWS